MVDCVIIVFVVIHVCAQCNKNYFHLDPFSYQVRAKLLSKQQAMERSEKAKKQREMKKFGKKVLEVVL